MLSACPPERESLLIAHAPLFLQKDTQHSRGPANPAPTGCTDPPCAPRLRGVSFALPSAAGESAVSPHLRSCAGGLVRTGGWDPEMLPPWGTRAQGPSCLRAPASLCLCERTRGRRDGKQGAHGGTGGRAERGKGSHCHPRARCRQITRGPRAPP